MGARPATTRPQTNDGASRARPWYAGRLLRRLGEGRRWAETLVRTRATGPISDDHFRDLSAYTHEDPAVLGPWIVTRGARTGPR